MKFEIFLDFFLKFLTASHRHLDSSAHTPRERQPAAPGSLKPDDGCFDVCLCSCTFGCLLATTTPLKPSGQPPPRQWGLRVHGTRGESLATALFFRCFRPWSWGGLSPRLPSPPPEERPACQRLCLPAWYSWSVCTIPPLNIEHVTNAELSIH